MIKGALLLIAFVAVASATVDINSINAAQKTWKAGVNHRFANLTTEQVKRFLGVPLGKHPWVAKLPKQDLTNVALPDNFDSRTNWPKCTTISQVRDQSACGSCWAFSAATAQSDRLCVGTKGAVNVALSTEDLVSCCESCGDGCQGGYPEAAWQYFQQTGMVSEASYPYALPPCEHHTTGHVDPCGEEQPTPPCDKSKLKAKKYYGASTYAIESVEDIQNEIMTYGPVSAAFTVYEDFVNYKSGVYQHTSGSALGGHAIRVLGWGVENGTPYWLCVNSWNADWGDNGTFKILRGSNECGIEDNVVAGRVKA